MIAVPAGRGRGGQEPTYANRLPVAHASARCPNRRLQGTESLNHACAILYLRVVSLSPWNGSVGFMRHPIQRLNQSGGVR